MIDGGLAVEMNIACLEQAIDIDRSRPPEGKIDPQGSRRCARQLLYHRLYRCHCRLETVTARGFRHIKARLDGHLPLIALLHNPGDKRISRNEAIAAPMLES